MVEDGFERDVDRRLGYAVLLDLKVLHAILKPRAGWAALGERRGKPDCIAGIVRGDTARAEREDQRGCVDAREIDVFPSFADPARELVKPLAPRHAVDHRSMISGAVRACCTITRSKHCGFSSAMTARATLLNVARPKW